MWKAELLCVSLTCYNAGWISGQGDKFCVCVCVFGMSGWAHRSAVSSYLLCHTDGSVSEPHTQPLQQARCEHAANYSTMSSLHRSFLGSVTSFHTVYSWLMGNSAHHCKWLWGKHKYHGLEHSQLLFWFNVPWINELFCFFVSNLQHSKLYLWTNIFQTKILP